MKVQKCRNGHYFDTDTYQTCPLCGAQTEDVKPSMTDNVKIKKKSTVHIFTKKGKKTTGGEFAQAFDSNEPGHSYDSRQRNGIDKGTFDDRTAQQEQWNERGPSDGGMIRAKTNSQAGSLNDKTQDIWQPTSFSGKSTNDIVDPVGEEPGTAGTNRIDALPMSGDIQRQKGTKPSLADEIKQVSSVADGKTMSFFSAYMDSGDSGARSAAVLDPVVGWLVCIRGEHLGESFSIFSGMNTIGRSSGNRIVIDRDNSVSREKHALITFEPKQRKFYIKPGDSSGLTYVNGEYIMETRQLFVRDTIEIGNGKFLLIPLCDDKFAWEDYITSR